MLICYKIKIIEEIKIGDIVTLKKGKNNKIIFIIVISGIVLFIAFMVYELIARSTGMKSLMGNSITTSFYYCEDTSYTLNNNKCVKSDTTASNLLGDVNLDGVVNNTDLELLNKYLAKTADLTEIQLTAADVNSDGIISVGDAENIRLYVTGHNSGSEYLSKIGTGVVCPKDYVAKDSTCIKETIIDAKYASYKRGDINLDGVVDNKDLELLGKYLKRQANLNTVQVNVADYNGTGNIDDTDLYEMGEYLNSEVSKVNTLGDINSDNVIDSKDVVLLEKYVAKQIKLNKETLEYADMNEDDVIDLKDVELLSKSISDFYQIGDVNLDGKIDLNDVSLYQNMLNGVLKFTKVQINLSDINGDLTIDNNDVIALRSKVGNSTKLKKGDVNLDGKVTSDDVTVIENYALKKTELTIEQLNYADYNVDSTVDNKDANSLAKAIASKYQVGDINMDGKINIVDTNILSKYISKLIELDTTQKILADINGDGKINVSDLKK